MSKNLLIKFIKPLMRYPVFLASAGVLLTFSYFFSRVHYLAFHSVAELISIVIACSIFMFAWRSQKHVDNDFILFLGIAYLFVGGLDLLHMLTYKGMGVFPISDSDTSIQLWIAGRYVESISFLIALHLKPKRIISAPIVFGIYFIVFVLVVSSIFYFKIFPSCYINDQGLTPFKIISEYIVSGIFLLAVYRLYQNRKHFSDEVVPLMAIALVISIITELLFTLYSDLYGLVVYIGHLFRIGSYYALYRITIEVGFSRPHEILFKALQTSELMFKTAINYYPCIFIIYDVDQSVSFINQSGIEMIRQHLVYHECSKIADLINEYFGPSFGRALPKVYQTKTKRQVDFHIHHSGQNIYLRAQFIPILNHDHIIQKVLCITQDQTDAFTMSRQQEMASEKAIKDIQEQINATQKELAARKKLSDIGKLAATVAHELRNPLSVISTAAYNIQLKRKNPQLDSHIQNIEEKITESDQIIENLLNYARLKPPELSPEWLNPILDDSIATIKTRYPHNPVVINRRTELLNELPIMIDKYQMIEVFNNIIQNAFEAMPHGGELTISTQDMPPDYSYLILQFSDTGVGIASAEIAKIFDPFYSQKPKGTGLGLSISQEIVHLHQGTIKVKSASGNGMTVKLTLPFNQTTKKVIYAAQNITG